MIPLGD